MYEELLPLWKDYCRRMRAGAEYHSNTDPWAIELRRHGYEWQKPGHDWNWIGPHGKEDCLVGGIMLFIFEEN